MIPLIVLGNKPPATPSAPDVQQPDTSNFAQALTIIAALALFGVPILVFAKISAGFDAKIAGLRQDEWEAFDWKKRAWKNSFYCHYCDSIFNPASRPEA
jgi:cytochrome P450